MKEIQAEIRRDRIENDSRKTELQGKVSSGLKTAKSSVKAEGDNGINTKVASVLKTTAAVGSVAANMISTAMPAESGDDLSSNAANEFREKAGVVTDKSLSAVKSLAEKKIEDFKHPKDTLGRQISNKVKGKIASGFNSTQLGQGVQNIRRQLHNVKASATNRINNIAPVRAVRNAKNKVKRLEKKVTRNVNKIKRTVLKAVDPRRILNKNYGKLTAKNVKKLRKKAAKKQNRTGKIKNRLKNAGKAAGYAVRGVSGTVGAASRARSFTSGDDTGNNLAEMGKDVAAKGAEMSFRATKKVLKKPAKAVTKQVKKVGKRAVKTAVNKVKKKIAKKTAKTAAKATQRTIKTSVKTVKATAKVIANAAKIAAKIAVQAAKAAIQAAVKVGQALVELLATPVGWIILGVVLVVVLIVILFNTLSGAAGATTSVVSGVGSSLSWLFGGDSGSTNSNDDIAELYKGFEETAHTAMDEAKTYYKDQISNISFGDRDTLVFNGSSFYPASAADDYISNYFDNLDYDDYKYLMEMCYIKKLRDERAAQGLSESQMPEVTIDMTDIKNFLLNYCFSFDISIEGGQTCPTADCCSYTYSYTSHCGGGESCSNHDDDNNCLGHDETGTTYYCDHSHIKASVTLQKVLKDELENDILALTDEERDLLSLGLDILNDATETTQP